MKAFNIKEKTRSVFLDIIPYEVTDEKHLDRYDPEERAVPGALWYKRPFKVHRDVGADDQTVVCRGSIKKKCPICEYVAEKFERGPSRKQLEAEGYTYPTEAEEAEAQLERGQELPGGIWEPGVTAPASDTE